LEVRDVATWKVKQDRSVFLLLVRFINIKSCKGAEEGSGVP